MFTMEGSFKTNWSLYSFKSCLFPSFSFFGSWPLLDIEVVSGWIRIKHCNPNFSPLYHLWYGFYLHHCRWVSLFLPVEFLSTRWMVLKNHQLLLIFFSMLIHVSMDTIQHVFKRELLCLYFFLIITFVSIIYHCFWFLSTTNFDNYLYHDEIKLKCAPKYSCLCSKTNNTVNLLSLTKAVFHSFSGVWKSTGEGHS